MTEITITDRERQLLDLLANGEATRGSDPYISLFPSSTKPELIGMTIAEVLRFQESRSTRPACGRYQFKPDTLRDCVGYLGIDPARTRFTPDVQDALIIARLKEFRQMDDWLAGTLPTDRFMIKLAQEFSSMPVPYPMQGARRQVSKGETYYSGNNVDRSKVDPGPNNPNRIAIREAGTDTLYQELEDIRTSGAGGSRTIPVNADSVNGALPATGTTPRAQAAAQAAGVGVGAYVGGNAGARPLTSTILPPATGTVYQYRNTDPLDDRYDFRTGEKIKDLSIHGTGPASATPVINGNIGPANVAVTNIGVEPPIPAPEIGSSVLSQVAELQAGVSSAVGDLLTDPTSAIASIAERARSLVNLESLNSALTGGRTTDATSFDSAVITGSPPPSASSTTPANRSTPPSPVSSGRR